MSILKSILDIINENSGLTLLISAIIYAIHEGLKTRNAKKLQTHNTKSENISKKTYDAEEKLYKIISGSFTDFSDSEKYCIDKYEEARTFIMENDLYLRENLSKIGTEFADYMIDDVGVYGRDIKKQAKILKSYKKYFRS